MKLQSFVSCWGNEVDQAGALRLARLWQADGIEGPPPRDPMNATVLLDARQQGLRWIAEAATGGGYVPSPHLNAARHLDDLRHLIEASLPFAPLLVNALAGSDCWSFGEQVRFFERAMQLGTELGVTMAFETHRSRPTFHPWVTRDLLMELPEMQLTCDFSHWCVVCERRVMDEEPELLDLFAARAAHLHARVGYDQGPQVPDPRAPEYRVVVYAHFRWWRHVMAAQTRQGREIFTVTPEFGPDGYLHLQPFTGKPVADLQDLNAWMMQRLPDVMMMA